MGFNFTGDKSGYIVDIPDLYFLKNDSLASCAENFCEDQIAKLRRLEDGEENSKEIAVWKWIQNLVLDEMRKESEEICRNGFKVVP
jgi:NAD-dependent DNA ligase